MQTQFSRNELLLGADSTAILFQQSVAIFGIGGVGSFVAESLARSGIGKFMLCDADVVCLSNLNRQLIATRQTIGKPKVEVMRDRILEINPDAEVAVHQCFYGVANSSEFAYSEYSYMVDCIDTVSSKLLLVESADANHIPIISCMGAGNKLDPTKFEIADIKKTSVCPLARVMRHELKKRRIKKLKVLYSKETPLIPLSLEYSGKEGAYRKLIPGSVSFVPSVAGLIIAGEVVKDLLKLHSGLQAKGR